MGKLYYNEITLKVLTEEEFKADCMEYINSLDAEEKPTLEEVMLNTDYIYPVSDKEVENMIDASQDGISWIEK